jgi:hypothetical protein
MNFFADETLGENRLRQNVKIQDANIPLEISSG